MWPHLLDVTALIRLASLIISCLGPLSLVSPGVGIMRDVTSPIPPSSVSCYDNVVDVGVTAQCREVVLREAACDNLLLVARQVPSVLLEASSGQVVVKCQVPDTNSIVCDDSCRLSRSDK